MKWSWKFIRVAGIDVYIHATFFILIVWIGLSFWIVGGNLAAVVTGVSFILALFTCVVLHELGHALTARRYGIRTRNIILLPIGGVAAMERMPDDPKQEIAVALAGPSVNLIIAFVLWLWLSLSNSLQAELFDLTEGGHPSRSLLERAHDRVEAMVCGRESPLPGTVQEELQRFFHEEYKKAHKGSLL